MSSVKRFLIACAVIYMVLAILINITLGPPGLSGDYLDEFKPDHERYLYITKGDDYKLWAENPELHPPNEKLSDADIEFVSDYEDGDAYQAEVTRRWRYQAIFDFLTFTMIIILGVRFGKAPVLAFLDARVDEVRRRIQRAEDASAAAVKRKGDAQTKLDGLDQERTDTGDATQRRIELERARIEESTAQALALLERETEDRRHQEELKAQGLMKRELVDEAIEIISERYKAERTKEQESVIIDQLMQQLEKME